MCPKNKNKTQHNKKDTFKDITQKNFSDLKKELYLQISEHTLMQEHIQGFGFLGRRRNHVLEKIWLASDFPTVISNARRQKECLQGFD